MRKYIFTILLSLTVVLISNSTKAQEIEPEISISPAVFEFEVVGGEVIKRQIKFTNNSDVALPVKVKTVDFDSKDETGGIRFISEVKDYELAPYRWLEIDPVDFIVLPNATKVIDMTITVPREAIPGGHYTSVLFEPQLPSFYFTEGSTKIIPIVGSLVLFNVQKQNLANLTGNPLTVAEFNLSTDGQLKTAILTAGINRLLAFLKVNRALAASDFIVYEIEPQKILLKLRNNDIFHVKPVGEIKVYNIFNRLVASADLPQTTILPQRVRQIPLDLAWQGEDGFLPAAYGKYRLNLTAQAGKIVINETLEFWIFPWKFILSTVAIFGLFMYFVLKYRRRLLISFKILISKKSN